LRKTAQGWSFELAEFAKPRGIADEPAFAWWVPHTLSRRNAILSAVKARVRKKTHNYGIEVPTSFDRAKELDRINGHILWMDALKLEMHNVGVGIEVLVDGKIAMDEGKWPHYLGPENGLH
jgi:hypothetical protein